MSHDQSISIRAPFLCHKNLEESIATYHWVFRVNFQHLGEGCVCFSVVILTEVDKGPGKHTNTP